MDDLVDIRCGTDCLDENQLRLLCVEPDCVFEARAPAVLADHCASVHGFVVGEIDQLSPLPVLVAYLRECRRRREDGHVLSLEGKTGSADARLRSAVREQLLRGLLRLQAREREDRDTEHDCLFCESGKGRFKRKSDVLLHMRELHGFKLGSADNLVGLSALLRLCRRRLKEDLECLQCSKTYATAGKVREHMKKKRHLRLNANSTEFDRFFVVNYLEAGRTWKDLRSEVGDNEGSGSGSEDTVRSSATTAAGDGDDDDDSDANWDEWVDDGEQRVTQCLFCDEESSTPQASFAHARQAHDGFQLPAGLDFYGSVKLINFLRRCVNVDFRCPQCAADGFEGRNAVLDHVRGQAHFRVPDDRIQQLDESFLVPTVPQDPLLTGFESLEDSSDSEEEAGMRAATALSNQVRDQVQGRLARLGIDVGQLAGVPVGEAGSEAVKTKQ